MPSVLVLATSPVNGAVNPGGEDRLLLRQGDLIVNSSHPNALFNANSTIQALDGQEQVVGGFSNLGQALLRGRVGAYFKSNVTVGHLLCFHLMMNTGSTLLVRGAPVDDPVWEEGQ